MGKFIDLTGKKFGRLTVLYSEGKIYNSKNRCYYWMCRCDCGNLKSVRGAHLKNGLVNSCGCLKKEKLSIPKKHGFCDTKIYGVWEGIKDRCYRQKNSSYKNYGGRGIIMCEDWKNNFSNFYNWAIQNGYKEGLSIDRIDVNGNYEPTNCRWITQKEQCNNTRVNRYLTYQNVTHSLSEWAEIYNLNYFCLRKRIDKHWDIEKALLTPSRHTQSS